MDLFREIGSDGIKDGIKDGVDKIVDALVSRIIMTARYCENKQQFAEALGDLFRAEEFQHYLGILYQFAKAERTYELFKFQFSASHRLEFLEVYERDHKEPPRDFMDRINE